jgi:hypothetical protein
MSQTRSSALGHWRWPLAGFERHRRQEDTKALSSVYPIPGRRDRLESSLHNNRFLRFGRMPCRLIMEMRLADTPVLVLDQCGESHGGIACRPCGQAS